MAYDQQLEDDRTYSYLTQTPWGNQDTSPSAPFGGYSDVGVGYASGDPGASIDSVGGVDGVDVSGAAGVGMVGLEDETYGEGDLSGISGVGVGLGGEGDDAHGQGQDGLKRSNSKAGQGGRKRRKSNASDGAGVGGTPGGKGGQDKKFKPGTSCAECRRLKIKCDRNIPCSGCQKRGCGDLCPEESIGSIKQLLQDRSSLSARVRELEAVLHISGAGSPPHAPAFQYPGAKGLQAGQQGKGNNAAGIAQGANQSNDPTDLLSGADGPIDPHLLALSVDPSLSADLGVGVGDDGADMGDVSSQFPHPDTLRRNNFPPTDAAKRWSALGGGSGTIADLEDGAKANGWQNFSALGEGGAGVGAEGGWDGRLITVDQAQAELPAEGEADTAVKSVFDKMGQGGLPLVSKDADGVVKSIYASASDSGTPGEKLHTLAVLHALLALNTAAQSGSGSQQGQKHAALAQRCLSTGGWLGSDSVVVAQAAGLLVKYLEGVTGSAAQRVRGQVIGVQGRIVLANGLHLFTTVPGAGVDKEQGSTLFWAWYVSEITRSVALGVPPSVQLNQINVPYPSAWTAGSFAQTLAEAAKVVHSVLDTSLHVPPAGWGEIAKAWQKITAFEASLPAALRCPSAYKCIPSSALPTAAGSQAQQTTLALLLSQGVIHLLRPYFIASLSGSAQPAAGVTVCGVVERALAIVASVQSAIGGGTSQTGQAGKGKGSKSATAQPTTGTPGAVSWGAWELALDSASLLALAASNGQAAAAPEFLSALSTSLAAASGVSGSPAGQKAIGWLKALQAVLSSKTSAAAAADAAKPTGAVGEWMNRLGQIKLGSAGVEGEGKGGVKGVEEGIKKGPAAKEGVKRGPTAGQKVWEKFVEGQDKDVAALTGLPLKV